MIYNIFRTRFIQGHQTMAYPAGPAPAMPERFAGLPRLDRSRCAGCAGPGVDACPTGAILRADGRLRFDLGRCVFCRECEHACPTGAIAFGKDYRLASSSREGLVVGGANGEPNATPAALNPDASGLYGRVFSLRVVSAGGCGACEADTNVLNTLAWDLGRFGVSYAASPRHADGMLLIGPVPDNMEYAVRETYDAIPDPKFVIAVGTCAISGGAYASRPECLAGRAAVVPVDLFIPGCPPHPMTILDGMLRFLGKVRD